MMMMPFDQWREYWPERRKYIVAACEHGNLSISDIEQGLSTGEYQLVVLDGGAVVVNLEEDSLHITATGGDFDYDWMPGFLDYIAAVALSMGRRKLTGCGRKGWGRRLRSRGWKVIDGHYEVDL